VAGVVVGTIASQPIISQTAMSFGLPATFEVSLPAVAAVVGLALLTALVASIGPAVRAGRLSVVAAITRGTAPSARAGAGRFRRFGLALPAPLPVRLGVAAGASHPARAAMTLGALTVGVVAATFALGLNLSLMRVMEDINRDQATPVRVELPSSDPARAAGVSAAIAADPQTARFVALGEGEVAVPRLGAARFVGYQGDASWIGYALISGRWFTAPGEVVAPTALFTATGLHVGDTLRLTLGGRSVDVRLVGEVFDAEGSKDDLLAVRGTWADLATLDPAAVPDAWEAQPTAGVDPAAYRSGLIDATDRTVPISLSSDSSGDASFLLFLTVVGVLGLVLVATSLAGVFNTVLLETRQRSREIAVLKTVGLTPRQVVGLVVSSIAPVALAAGVIGVPLGMVAQRAVLGYMGQVAARTAIPESVFDVFSPALLVALLLLGLAIGAAGAFLPARRVARAPIAPVLQAE
jgi:putative ABC transport system permease protein